MTFAGAVVTGVIEPVPDPPLTLGDNEAVRLVGRDGDVAEGPTEDAAAADESTT